MGNNFFNLLKTAISQRFSPIILRLRNLFNPSRLKALFTGRITRFLRSLLNVKPKDKDDYYTIFNYMVSKKLAYLLVVVIGVACGMFVYRTNQTFFDSKFATEDVRTYKYNSMLLRMAKGKVRIKGKSGYIAYEGNVEDGYVTGNGTLYYPDGAKAYTGNFDKSMYEGDGIRFYQNGNIQYKGTFAKNLLNGTGEEYRENGSLLYSGDFVNGIKEGIGDLFDNGGNKVYTGRFSRNNLLYSDILGKKVSEVNEAYFGKMTLYSDDDTFAVYMQGIDAIYSGLENNEAIEDEVVVDKVYVLKSEFPVYDGMASVPKEVTEYLGEPIFEGTSYLTEEEAIAMNLVREQTGERYYSDPGLSLGYEYDDYYTVEGYDSNKMVYLYTYYKDGLEYNFVCENQYSGFGFYYLTQGDEGVAADEEDNL